MNLQIVAIYDSALGEFFAPIFVRSIGLAIRDFGDEVTKADSPLSRHPADFLLFHLGSFDPADGSIASFTPAQISRAVDFVSPAG